MKKLLIALLSLCMLFCTCFMLACDEEETPTSSKPPIQTPTTGEGDGDEGETTPGEGETTPGEGETTPDEGGGETTTPDDGNEGTTPDDSGDTTTPDEGGDDTTTPDEGEGDTTTPDDDETTEHAHSLAYIPAKAVTCTTDGNIEYYFCITCSKKFIIENEQSKEVSNVVITAGHDFSVYNSDNNATCEQNGTETANCNRDGCNQTDTRVIENSAYGHSLKFYSKKDPTCLEVGYKAYKMCLTCSYTTYEEISALGHTPTTLQALAPTCTRTGLEAGEKCSACQEILTAQTVIDALGHSYLDGSCERCKELQSKGLSFSLINNDTEYEVKRGTCTDTEVVIPSTYNDKTVTSIGGFAFYNCSLLTDITIPNSVTSMGYGAFEDCSSLESVQYNGSIDDWAMIEFGSYEANPLYYAKHLYINGEDYLQKTSIELTSATKIDTYAFYRFDSLESITIPDSVTSIGDDAFSGCDNLQYNEYDNGLYLGNENNKYVVLVKAKDINITSCSINENTRFIHSSAFSYCGSLTSITIPDSVTSIGSHAFSDCSSLTSVTIPDSVTYISYAFSGCSSLESILVDENNENYASQDGILYNKAKTEIIEVPKGISGDITIPDTITSIGDYAFSRCSSLTSVTIGECVTGIGYDAFYYCSSLESVYYNGTIDDWAMIEFENYSANPLSYAKHLYINGEEVTQVNLTTATKISGYAFYNCSSLTSVTIGECVTGIGYDAFRGCSSLESITVESGNSKYHSAGNCLIETKSKTLIFGCNTSVIPDDGSVTSIGSAAFSGCSSLTSIVIPDSVTSIGDDAFSWCSSLTEINFNATAMNDLSSNGVFYNAGEDGTGITVNIGANVTKIPAYLFGSSSSSYSPKITSVVFAENSVCESIGYDAFYYCSSLESVYYNGTIDDWAMIEFENYSANPLYYAKHLYINGEEVTEVNLTTATKINNYAFSGYSSLTSITIPNSVTSIGDSAFSVCDSLTSITIPDSVTSIGSSAFYSCDKLVEVINLSSHITVTKGSDANGYLGYYALRVLTQEPEESNFTYIDDFIFYEYEGKYYLMGYIGSETEISLPDNVNGNNYEIYKYAFYCNQNITKVIIGEGVTSIGNYAFYKCSSLTSITIPDSVTSIGYYAFEYCSSLTSVVFEDVTTWYRRDKYSSSAREISVTDSSTNARNLRDYSYYADNYWYKI